MSNLFQTPNWQMIYIDVNLVSAFNHENVCIMYTVYNIQTNKVSQMFDVRHKIFSTTCLNVNNLFVA